MFSILLVIHHLYETNIVWKDKAFCHPVADEEKGWVFLFSCLPPSQSVLK